MPAFCEEEKFIAALAYCAPDHLLAIGIALSGIDNIQAGIECTEYAPARVKQAVCGYGRAEKVQVQRMVKAILALPALPTPNHAADALAVAICHALAPPLLKLAG